MNDKENARTAAAGNASPAGKKGYRIALAGNPNCGKTTLFNAYTGSRQHVGNYPGVTVDRKEGTISVDNTPVTLVDLPGTYSLTAYSQEELVARDELSLGRVDAVIDCADASALERNMLLTVQMMEMGMPVVLACNMMDEARKAGIHIDMQKLSEQLGTPVLPIVARNGEGIREVARAALDLAKKGRKEPLHINYGPELTEAVEALEKRLSEEKILIDRYHPHWTALKLLEGDTKVQESVREARPDLAPEILSYCEGIEEKVKAATQATCESVITDARYGYIRGLLAQGVVKQDPGKDRLALSDRLDKILTNRFLGPLIMIGVLYLMFVITFNLGAYPQEWLEDFFAWMGSELGDHMDDGLLKSLICDGIIAGVGGVVSFVPLFFLSGMEGRMLVPLGIAFIVALFASTVVALTLTPVLCSYLLNRKPTDKKVEKEAWVARKLKDLYGKALNGALAHKNMVLGCTIGLFLVALGMFFTLGRSFLPPFNEGSFTINVSSLPGISLEESDEMGRRAEELLMQVPEIQTVARKTGRAELDEHALGVNVSEIEAPFVLKDRSRDAVMNDVREKLSTISGANIEIGQPISHRIDAMLSGTEANIAIKLFGTDLNLMFTVGNQIKEAIQGIPGLVDLKVEQQIERPQLTITPKRELMAQYGITLPEFEEYVNVMLGGEAVSQVYDNGKTFDLTVKTSDESRATMEDIRNLMIDAGGKKVPLSYVAEIRSVTGPNTINRENVQRKIVISGNVSERDLRSIVNEIQQKIDASIQLPEGYHIEYGGQFESEQAASRTLLLTSLMSLLVIFLLLYNEFKNAKESGVILLNLPLALIGGVFILKLTSGEVSIPAIIGFISLFGIATRNGMLLISHYTHLRTVENVPLKQAVLQGSMDRLNPILMTALSSALALIPLALNGDLPGNEIQSPMATVILGGLLTSTFLNGFIIPIVYLLMNKEDKE